MSHYAGNDAQVEHWQQICSVHVAHDGLRTQRSHTRTLEGKAAKQHKRRCNACTYVSESLIFILDRSDSCQYDGLLSEPANQACHAVPTTAVQLTR